MRYNFKTHIDKKCRADFMAKLRARNDPSHVYSRIMRTKRKIQELSSTMTEESARLQSVLRALEAKHARLVSDKYIQHLTE